MMWLPWFYNIGYVRTCTHHALVADPENGGKWMPADGSDAARSPSGFGTSGSQLPNKLRSEPVI
jgi:hypothetical protein